MPANYVLLAKNVVGAVGVSSVTFSNIPQTGYTDLVVKVSARGSTNNTYDNLQLKFNGVSSSYTDRHLVGPGNGIAVSSGTNLYTTSSYLGSFPALNATATTFGNTEIYIPNYTSANNKSYYSDSADERNVTTGVWSALTANLWSNTAAITTIQLLAAGGDFVQYSTFYLYGVAKSGTTPAIAPYATGGDVVTTDGTYWYHAFLATGTFTPRKALTCDYLVVAGGGGGGSSNNSGGGGAGGYLTSTGFSTASGVGLTVTIGAGGTGGVGSNVTGTSGSNSVFSSITSTGGGGGGGENSNGAAGGSSGGGGYNGNAGTRTASPVQGNNGANGSLSSPFPGGGGGGAGAAGSAAQGGAGLNTLSTWFSATGTGVSGYVAGGGSGGRSSTVVTGGAGGGGNGGQNGGTAPTAAIQNTGSGGGGGAVSSGAAGGSGLVIVRYPV